ncbi:UNVERIFIED_CONTAM: preprotein translocase subunit SecA [Acetivibrio alkalicellulosi]
MFHKISNIRSAKKEKFYHKELMNKVELIKKVNLINCKDSFLKVKSQNLMHKAMKGCILDHLLVDSYALVYEAIRRVLSLEAYDVQIMGAIALHNGKLIEMQTGEGKTLAAVFPAYLNALTGKGIHVLTANDYLAERDAEWMGPVFRFLNLSVGFINEGMSREQRKKAYCEDITYITAKEAGFDYLRDSLCYDISNIVQRDLNYAIVDEVDSILIDESRVPLVIAENKPSLQKGRGRVPQIVEMLRCGIDYDFDDYYKSVYLTDKGIDTVEKMLKCENIYAPENYELLLELNSSLHAKVLIKRNVDYIVENRKIELVDAFTGRIADKRMLPEGLQRAVEVKEGLKTISEGKILGSITIQNYLKLYTKVCGMTATAMTSANEFNELHDLDIVRIPTNRPCIRKDYGDLIFSHKEAKFNALISEIKNVHGTKRPILIGTGSIEESEELSEALKMSGIKCNVLNAKNDMMEASIIAQAGRLSSVTVSTNMAGRGTDIRLGGINEKEKNKVVELGGLYVIGTNKNESRRIDNQLIGRAGRQGDPGSSKFFISLEDTLFKQYGSKTFEKLKKYLVKQDTPIDNLVYSHELAGIQRVAEGQNENIRRLLWRYSSIFEEQRKIIYQMRQDILFERTTVSLLKNKVHHEYSAALKFVDYKTLNKIEKHISLFHIDYMWSTYIDQVNYIREGIHLYNIGGHNPLEEYYRLVIQAFSHTLEEIDKRIIYDFKKIDFSKGDINLDKIYINGPSSTWTYQITDNPFADDLGLILANDRNIGAASIGMLLIWPIILFGFIYTKIKKSNPIK